MISRSTLLLLLLALSAAFALAAEIREFDVPTLQRLGSQLIRASRQPERGATDAVRKQARQTAIAALRGKLFPLRYDYVVLSDPDGKGFLVYALGKPSKAGEVVLAGHARVTVSPDGTRVERIDRLSQTMLVLGGPESRPPAGYKPAALYFNQIVSHKPVETFIYLANLARKNIYVSTPDGKIWVVNSRGMKIDRSKASDKTEAGAVRKAFDQGPPD